MKRAERIVRKGTIQPMLTRGARRIALSLFAFVATTLFVLVACSAPQNQSGQSGSPNTGPQPTAADWKEVAQALGKEGSVQPGDVYKVSLPRSDLKVTVNGVELKPALALGSWVAFKKTGDMTVVMGDLVSH